MGGGRGGRECVDERKHTGEQRHGKKGGKREVVIQKVGGDDGDKSARGGGGSRGNERGEEKDVEEGCWSDGWGGELR